MGMGLLASAAGLRRNKPKNAVAAAWLIAERFGGEVPRTVAELVTLPGVGRRTANVVVANAFGGLVPEPAAPRGSDRLDGSRSSAQFGAVMATW